MANADVDLIIGSEFLGKVVPLIDDSTETIDILIYDWRVASNRPHYVVYEFNSAILRAVARGVIIRAVCTSFSVCAALNRVGIKAKVLDGSRRMHAKMLLIDNKVIVLGSHNYTQSAFRTNHETSAALFSSELGAVMSIHFDLLWGL